METNPKTIMVFENGALRDRNINMIFIFVLKKMANILLLYCVRLHGPEACARNYLEK